MQENYVLVGYNVIERYNPAFPIFRNCLHLVFIDKARFKIVMVIYYWYVYSNRSPNFKHLQM